MLGIRRRVGGVAVIQEHDVQVGVNGQLLSPEFAKREDDPPPNIATCGTVVPTDLRERVFRGPRERRIREQRELFRQGRDRTRVGPLDEDLELFDRFDASEGVRGGSGI